MANFKYYEDDYELAVLELLENCDWEYQCGYDIHREKDDIKIVNKQALISPYASYNVTHITRIIASTRVITILFN